MSRHWDTLKSIIAESADPVVVEPGACHGAQTDLLSSAMTGGRHFAIEPDPRNVVTLNSRTFPPCVRIIAGAIADHTGTAPFYPSTGTYPGGTWDDWNASGSCRKPGKCVDQHTWLKFKPAILVQCWTLDDFCTAHDIDHIDLIHADIQGCERDLIEHGTQILQRTRYMNLEVSEGGGCYEGSWNLDDMLDHLPDWEMVEQFGPDVLFRNLYL